MLKNQTRLIGFRTIAPEEDSLQQILTLTLTGGQFFSGAIVQTPV